MATNLLACLRVCLSACAWKDKVTQDLRYSVLGTEQLDLNPERGYMTTRYQVNGKETSLAEVVKLAQRCGYRGPIRVVSSQMKEILKRKGYNLTKK